jgi:pimeloyl-ACP methyl ester carboxylesterase
MQPTLVEDYYNLLDAPKGKSLIWFDDSAHSPCLEEPVRFGEVMVTRVLAETLAAQHP